MLGYYFRDRIRVLTMGRAGKNQSSAHALSLRIRVLPKRVLDPVTGFGRERMVRHEINLFSSLRALVHRISDKQHLLPTACTEFTHEKMKSESKTLIKRQFTVQRNRHKLGRLLTREHYPFFLIFVVKPIYFEAFSQTHTGSVQHDSPISRRHLQNLTNLLRTEFIEFTQGEYLVQPGWQLRQAIL